MSDTTKLPEDVLNEVDLLDDMERATLAGICLNTIDISEEHLAKMFAEFDEDELETLFGQLEDYIAFKRRSPRPATPKRKRSKR